MIHMNSLSHDRTTPLAHINTIKNYDVGDEQNMTKMNSRLLIVLEDGMIILSSLVKIIMASSSTKN